MTWRYYRICPFGERMNAKLFYAPDLLTAFTMARCEWPSALAWESL